uniref:Tyrosyl-DNA phosphodiesterase n=1 Tax=Strongyloides papillosus TaxID=174720 RepID=A0A0N5BE10_STREA
MDDMHKTKKAKLANQDDIATISQGMHLNKLANIPYYNQIKSVCLKEFITTLQPKLSYHFTFYASESFLDEIYANYKIGLENTTLIIGVGRDIIKAVKEQEHENKSIKRKYVPMEPYASHHCKLSIFFDHENRPHVAIMTGNLEEDEWSSITQALYYAKGEEKAHDYESSKDMFLIDLLQYLESGYKNQIFFEETIQPLMNNLKCWSFLHIKDRLIFSIYDTKIPKFMKDYSINKIKLLLEENKEKLREISYFVVQCSSIGFMGISERKWLIDRFLKNITNGQLNSLNDLKIIYPSLDDVRNSINGYRNGNLFPYTKRNKEKQGKYINPCLHRWSSENLKRTLYLPHLKTYTAFDSNNEPIYQIVGSQNLSKAAWGEIDDYGTFVMKNYEIGVFTLDRKSMVIPYDIPLVKYQSDQQIWTGNESHMEPDCHGRIYVVSDDEESFIQYIT